IPCAVGQHRRGAAGGARGRHPLPRPVSGRLPALLPDLRREHARRVRAAEAAAAVPLPMSTPLAKTLRGGEPFIWLTGGALAISLLLVAGLLGLIVVTRLGVCGTNDGVRLAPADGRVRAGQVVNREPVPGAAGQHRIKVKVANRDLYGADFQWVDEGQIVRREYPPDIAVIERTEWGLLIG